MTHTTHTIYLLRTHTYQPTQFTAPTPLHHTHMSQEEEVITPLPPIEEPVVITTQLAIRTAPELAADTTMPYARGRGVYRRRAFYSRPRYGRSYRRRWY